MFTLDDEHRVVEFNEVAREQFGLCSESVGEPIEEVIDASVDDLTQDAPVNPATIGELWTETTVFLDTTDGRRRFQAETTDLSDGNGKHVGVAISLEDVTDRALREQRIAILNRVLRHNLRNKLSIVRGHAEMVPDAGDASEEYADAIETAASDLLALGERARDVERLLAVEAGEGTPVDEVVSSVLESCTAVGADATFTADLGADEQVEIPWESLEYALEELCENADKHNDAADPWVEVTTEPRGDWVAITVRDNGPPLSEQELVAIHGDGESPLEHGSGLGLWSVRWIVTAFGGEITVVENGEDGTAVELTVPISRDPMDAVDVDDVVAA